MIRWSAMFVLLTGMASAGPVTWSLVNTNFDDGGTASGFFVFNADTNTILNWNLNTTGGTALGAFQYVPGDSSAGVFSGVFEFWSNQLYPGCCGFLENRYLMLGVDSPLTNAGGTVNLTPGQFGVLGGAECLNCNPYRLITTGSVTSSDATIPEPRSLYLLALECVVLAVALRRLRAAPARGNRPGLH
jgi:hypothetical protein